MESQFTGFPQVPLNPPQTPRERLTDIDKATGLAIGFVVIGHFATGKIAPGAEWYFALKNTIYTFHMPFFMFLSGVVMYYTYRPVQSVQDYKAYVLKKFERLIPPYLLFSLIIFLGKVVAVHFIAIDNPIDSYLDYFRILYRPHASFSNSLWYIYVLFEFYLLLPLLLLALRRIEYLLVPAIIIHFVYVPEVMGLELICEFMVYFVLGCICVKHYQAYTQYLDKLGWITLALFLILSVYCYYTRFGLYTHKEALVVRVPGDLVAVLSIPALHYLVRLRLLQRTKLLSTLAAYTFPIYLMNTMAIGTVKALVFRLAHLDYHGFHLAFPFLLIGGVYGPILVKRHVLRYVPLLDRAIR
jgi:fucose 4-O-acetylase-like acetyltransferase